MALSGEFIKIFDLVQSVGFNRMENALKGVPHSGAVVALVGLPINAGVKAFSHKELDLILIHLGGDLVQTAILTYLGKHLGFGVDL